MRYHARSRARNVPKPKKCVATGKLRWPDAKAAIEVLHAAQNSRTRGLSEGTVSRTRERRRYSCPACAG